jgi:glycosyltransferase involved in cell wall biosynthesis
MRSRSGTTRFASWGADRRMERGEIRHSNGETETGWTVDGDQGGDERSTPAAESRPRHCMVVHAYYPIAETRVQREAEVLLEAGYAVDVICLRDQDEPSRERYRGVEIHRLPVRLSKNSLAGQLLSYLHFLLLATVRLTKLHRRHRCTTVQVHNLPDFLVFCAIVPKLQRVPIVLDLHDLMPEFFAGRFGPDRRRWLARLVRWQERLACRFADHVITVSDHWRRTLIQRGGVPEDKCSVVMNVADERIFVARPKPMSGSPRWHLIYHGTVTDRYGLDLALRAVGLLKEEIPEIQLTILGRGDHVPSLVELSRELNLEGHVELRDEFIVADELPEILAGADLGVVPYRDDIFTDGLLPTKLMEYAVMGIPCVAARTTAIEAYFKDTMVEFFTPGDADDLARCIRELRQDPERLARLAQNGERFTRRYNWKEIGAAYAALIDQLAKRDSPRLRSP